ncbi:MAG: hypothetical protein SFU56_05320 [Capsulimonadales bacterium]|nr:hypothetical protein [Capsulimonadales bacterium]
MEYGLSRKSKSNVVGTVCLWAVLLWCLTAGYYLFRYGQETEKQFAATPRMSPPPAANRLAR